MKKDRKLLFYPPLLAAFPVLTIYSANLTIVPLLSVVRPLVVVCVLDLLVWLIASKALRSMERGALVAGLLPPFLFGYGWLYQSIPTYLFDYATQVLYYVVTIGIVVAAVIWWKRHEALNLFASCLVIVSIASIATGLSKSAALRRSARAIASAKLKGQDRPDIFYIILDGYGRSDALKRSLGFDNSKFIADLESKGFFVAKNSRSNYCQTELSLGSSLNFDYLQNLVTKPNVESSDRGVFDTLIDNNRVAKTLRSFGYRIVTVTTGFPPVQVSTADEQLEGASATTLFENLLVETTPLMALNKTIESMYLRRRDLLNVTFETLQDLGETEPQPRFVFAHVLCPHPPFVFAANGGFVRQSGPFGFWDGSDFEAYAGTKENYRVMYSAQAAYLDDQVLKIVHALQTDAQRPPVIILQGDHGSKMNLDQNSLAKTDVNECFPNLNALYVPESVRKSLYDGISPVNEFRILFNNLFGTNYELLPDRSWYSPFATPFQFTEVTSRLH